METRITVSTADISMHNSYRGMILLNKTNDTRYLVLNNTNTTFNVRLFTWVMAVLMWNPCNTLELIIGENNNNE